MIKSVYLDTSVFGGYFDEEFSENTIPFFERLLDEKIQIFISELLISELFEAPEFVKKLLNSIPEEQQINVDLTKEAERLAEKYIEEKIVGKTSKADCQHIAIATICKVDVLVSWNFKHIVNLDRIRGYNSVNLKLGYSMIEIRTPKEIERYD
ncbi:MAG: hypothetical protein KAI99_12880 [Cyclobacteriaceae bacterium]|nr:hypothetical protein [Cyclobacteriaceae bacterium]